MADRLDHPLDLVFAALMDSDFQPRIAFGSADFIDLRRGGKTIFEFDSPFKRLDFRIVEDTLDLDEIGLRHMVARMEQRLG